MKPIEADTHLSQRPSIIQSLPTQRARTPEPELSPSSSPNKDLHPEELHDDRRAPPTTLMPPRPNLPMATVLPDEFCRTISEECGADGALIRNLLDILHRLQTKTALKHRFHLFVESERADSESGAQSLEALLRVQTRIAFSPTLSMFDREQESGLNRIYSELTNMSFQRAQSGSIVLSEQFVTPARHPIATTVPSRELSRSGDNIRAREQPGLNITSPRAIWPQDIVIAFQLASWCPFQGKEYTEGPQASQEHLFLDKDVVERFNALEDFQVMWIYQELFNFLHRQGRRRRILGMARTLTYSQFTPPWIRRYLALKLEEDPEIQQDGAGVRTVAHTVYLKKVAITHLRNERNMQGYRRVRFLLAAFFIFEPDSVKPLLVHLIRTCPRTRVVSARKVRKKRPIQTAQNVGSERAVRESTRANKRLNTGKVTEHEDPGQPNRSTDTEENPDLVNNRQGNTTENAAAPEGQKDRPATQPIPLSDTANSSSSSSGLEGPPLSKRSLEFHRNSKQSGFRGLPGLKEAFRGLPGFPPRSPKHTKTQTSVFDGLIERPKNLSEESDEAGEEGVDRVSPDAQKTKSPKQTVRLRIPQLPLPILVTRKKQQAGAPTNEETEYPRKEREDKSDSIYELNYEDDSNEHEDFFEGPMKCGSLLQCRWKLNDSMQKLETMDSKCKKCNYPMHSQCIGVQRLCRKCLTHKVFNEIQRDEREFYH